MRLCALPWRGAVMACLLLAPLPVLAQPADCPAFNPQDNRAPFYPPSEVWRLLPYTVQVVIEVDHCGRVQQAQLEIPSGIPVLDQLALGAARDWVVPPAFRGHPRYRLPFDFQPLPEVVPERFQARHRDPFFEERRSGHVAVPGATLAGTLPGYLHDAYPIGFISPTELATAIGTLGVVRHYGDTVNVWLRDEEGLSLFQWNGQVLVRNRLVDDGQHRFVVSSALCGPDLAACRQSLLQLQAARGEQHPLPLVTASP